jgi:formylglycine-generating enzyme required for sulfatase activity
VKRRRLIQYAGLSSIALFSGVGTSSFAATFNHQQEHRLGRLVNDLKFVNFDVATLDLDGREINNRLRQAQFFTTELGESIPLTMVAISAGEFEMGAADPESHLSTSAAPRHRVEVQPFFMSKHPIAQAQWLAVSQLPQVNRALIPDPAHFVGADRPVESVSWLDAVEFCDRLSQHTQRNYRLPSEAEWEYACRAGTTTPFSTGATLTSEFANYGTEFTYGGESPSEYLPTTTNVDRFAPNAFGLNDMHGNVWEWCADCWHETYQGAPRDSQAWIKNGDSDLRSLRGGSWADRPSQLRSASRSAYEADSLNRTIGFRVVCG